MHHTTDEVAALRRENETLRARIGELEQRLAVDDHFRGALDGMLEGFQLIGFDFRYLYLNRVAAEHGRRPREDLLGQTMMAAYPGIEQTPMFARLRECMETRRPHRLENEFTFPDGSTGWFELSIEPSPAGVVVLSIDVTERRRLEAQLRHAQKMEAIGRLAGGVAHDFNNLITVIKGYADLALQAVGADSPVGHDLAEALTAADRAGDLTGQLLAFSRRQTVRPKVVQLNDVVATTRRMLGRVLGEDIELVTRLADRLWNTRIDPGAFDQVLLNLGINARDAMAEGGTLVLETANVHLDEAYVLRRGVELPAGEYVVLAVTDSGDGMAPEVQERIFEPFFTTKPAGKGTGLGLATCYGIVAQAGGHISVYSERGLGTTFKIYLPRVVAPAEPAVVASHPASLRGSETVLVVEDNAQLRDIAVRSLREHGYQVLAAGDAGEALALCRAVPAVDLLLTDVILPDSNGRVLAGRVTSSQPQIKVLYMSGYTENVIVHRGVLDAGVTLLQKPFNLAQLLHAVRRVLEDTATEPG